MLKTFRRGGVHPPQNRQAAEIPIERIPLPDIAAVPLSQHAGAPAVAAVSPGDDVLTGQLIGRADGFISANVHSPVSGRVMSVSPAANAFGFPQTVVTIRREGDEWMPGIDRSEAGADNAAVSRLLPEEIIARVGEAGIVGLGGGAFPTHVKLTVPEGKSVDTLIVNGAECEPVLSADYRLMLERATEIVEGAKLMARALGARRICIGVEDNKPAAIENLRRAAGGAAEIVPLKTKYPQGCEKQLVLAVTGRRIPSGMLPVDVGAAVQNVATALAVREAVYKNKSLFERVMTVAGAGIARPSNFLARVGTPVSALIEAAGGRVSGTLKIIAGGPMMGRPVSNPGAPVVKSIGGIVLIDGREARRPAETYCIKCGVCVAVCPMGLAPYRLSKLSQKHMWAEAEDDSVTDCIECGCCAYACPAHIPLLDWIRLGKAAVFKEKASRGAAK